jgi:hypothetical protein
MVHDFQKNADFQVSGVYNLPGKTRVMFWLC